MIQRTLPPPLDVVPAEDVHQDPEQDHEPGDPDEEDEHRPEDIEERVIRCYHCDLPLRAGVNDGPCA